MTLKSAWRAGIVGVGRIGGGHDLPRQTGPIKSHAQAYRRHPGFQLAAVADTDPMAVSQFNERWGVTGSYMSAEEMQSSEGLDVVSVCSPDETHYVITRQLLTCPISPRVIFLEKPACLKANQIEDLIQLSKREKVPVFINHTRRFDPAHRRLAEVVRSGALGRLLWGRWTYFGGWMHNGVHLVDTLRMLFGEDPGVVSAVTASGGRPGDENLNARLSIGGGAVDVEAFDESYYQLFEGELRFEKGSSRLTNFGSVVTIDHVVENDIQERVLAPIEMSPLVGLDSPLYHALDAIDVHMKGRGNIEQLGVSLSDAAETMKILWQAQDSASAKLPPKNT